MPGEYLKKRPGKGRPPSSESAERFGAVGLGVWGFQGLGFGGLGVSGFRDLGVSGVRV